MGRSTHRTTHPTKLDAELADRYVDAQQELVMLDFNTGIGYGGARCLLYALAVSVREGLIVRLTDGARARMRTDIKTMRALSQKARRRWLDNGEGQYLPYRCPECGRWRAPDEPHQH